jgi:hypothetical protein
MVQCIFGHVGSISRDFVDSNRALSNLHGKWFGFSHTLDPILPPSCVRLSAVNKVHRTCVPRRDRSNRLLGHIAIKPAGLLDRCPSSHESTEENIGDHSEVHE